LREHEVSDKMERREVVAKIKVDMRDMKLAHLQRERLAFLLGPRWSPRRPHLVKIVTNQYPTHTENFVRANETLRELYWEALRAPTYNALFRRNPYRREKLLKHHFGRTKAERVVKMKELNDNYKAYIDEQDKRIVEEANAETEFKVSQRKKRLDYAKQRAKLGFIDTAKDKDTEGVEDPVFDKLAVDERKYQKMLEESRDRKPLRIPTEVEGISKQEINKKLLELPGAMFKP